MFFPGTTANTPTYDFNLSLPKTSLFLSRKLHFCIEYQKYGPQNTLIAFYIKMYRIPTSSLVCLHFFSSWIEMLQLRTDMNHA